MISPGDLQGRPPQATLVIRTARTTASSSCLVSPTTARGALRSRVSKTGSSRYTARPRGGTLIAASRPRCLQTPSTNSRAPRIPVFKVTHYSTWRFPVRWTDSWLGWFAWEGPPTKQVSTRRPYLSGTPRSLALGRHPLLLDVLRSSRGRVAYSGSGSGEAVRAGVAVRGGARR